MRFVLAAVAVFALTPLCRGTALNQLRCAAAPGCASPEPRPAGPSRTSVLRESSDVASDRWADEPIYAYDSLDLPKGMSRTFLQVCLQSFYDQKHGEAFRFLGDWRDFDHGHPLVSGGRFKGITFHTQEHAAFVAPDSPYAYLDKTKRNWIAFAGAPTVFHNALEYKLTERPADWKRYERNVTWAQLESYGTVVERMLDPEKLGFTPETYQDSEKSESIYFQKTVCPPLSAKEFSRSNVLKIDSPDGPQCLYISTMDCVLPQGDDECGAKPLRGE